MNHTYRVVYNEATNTYVAVAEFTPAKGKSKSSKAIATAVVALAGLSGEAHALKVNTAIYASSDTKGGSYDTVITAESGTASRAVTSAGTAVNNQAVAIGTDAQAGHNQTVAIGSSPRAMGEQSIAIGRLSNATNTGAIAIGNDATYGSEFSDISGTAATGYRAIAIGQRATATANQALAIGSGAKADTQNSLAIGFGAEAVSGGTSQVAVGMGALAVGKSATALGAAENGSNGRRTIALTPQSTAVGASAMAIGNQSSAVGNDVVSLGTGSVAIGTDDFGSIGDTRFNALKPTALRYQYGSTAADTTTGAVQIKGDNCNETTKVCTPETKYYNTLTLGAGTVAIGGQGQALADGAVAIGAGSLAGAAIKTDKNYNINSEIANGSVAADILGKLNVTSQMGTRAVAIGSRSFAASNDTTAIGALAMAGGQSSAAIAHQAVAYTNNSLAIGHNATAGAYLSRTTDASGAEIVSLTSKGGERAAAYGYHATAYANDSMAFGSSSNASNTNTTAVGTQAKASAVNATAIGLTSNATGVDSLAIGTGAKASGNQSISIGTGNNVSGNFSGAIGDPTVITGNATYTVGNNNTMASDSTGAFGNNNNFTAAANYSRAVGNNNTVSGTKTFVLGNNVTATTANSVILGEGSSGSESATTETSGTVNGITYSTFAGKPASTGDYVSVGNASNARQIKNVAAGKIAATSTDAINGSQLYLTQQVIGNLATSAANNFGGGVTVNPNGTLTSPTYTLNDASNPNSPTTANNVGDAITNLNTYVNKGWNVQENGTTKGIVTPGENVSFVGSGSTQVTVDQEANGTTVVRISSTGSGGSVSNTNLTVENGKVATPAAENGSSYVNATSLAEAINKTGWTATSGNVGTGVVSGTTKEEINPGDTVTFQAGDNMKLVQANGTFTYSVATGSVSANTTTNKAESNTTNGNIATVGDVMNAINNSGFSLSDGTNNTVVNPGDKVTFANGTGTTVSVVTNPDTNVSTIKVDVATSPVTFDNTTGTATPTTPTAPASAGDVANVTNATVTHLTGKGLNFAGNNQDATAIHKNLGETLEVVGGMTDGTLASDKNTYVENKDGKLIVKISDAPTFNNVTLGSGDTTVTLNPTTDGLKLGDQNNGPVQIKNVAAGTNGTDAVNLDQLNSTKWSLNTSANGGTVTGTQKETLVGNSTVNLIAGKGITIDQNGTNVTFSANADTTVNHTTLAVNGAGNITAPTGTEGASYVNASSLAQTLNNVSWNVIGGKEGTGNVTGNDSAEKVNFGDTVTLKAGDNMKLVQNGTNFTYSVATGSVSANTTTNKAESNTTNGNIATVGDVMNAINNSGFTVTSNNASKGEVVNPGDTVNFIGGNGTTVTTTTDNGTTTVKYETKLGDGLHFENGSIVANGTTINEGDNVKVTGNASTGYTISANNTQASVSSTDKTVKITESPNANGTKNYDLAVNVDNSTITKDPNGNLTVATTTLTNATTGAINVPTAPEGDKLVNATTVANAINNSGWNLGDGAGNTSLVNPSDTVNFVNGTGTVASIKANGTNGYDVSYSVANTTLPVEQGKSITAPTGDNATKFVNAGDLANTLNNLSFNVIADKAGTGTNTNGTNKATPVKAGDTVKFVAGDNINIAQDGQNFTISATASATVENTTLTVSDGKVDAPTATEGDKYTNATTVADVINKSGFGLTANGSNVTADGLVNAGDKINFVNGNGTTVVTDGKGGIQVDIKAADSTITAGTDGIKVNTGTSTVNNDGKAAPTTADEANKVATVGDIVNTINNVSWTAERGASVTTNVDGEDTATSQISAGDKVTFIAGKNMALQKQGNSFIYATKDDVTFNSVTSNIIKAGDNLNSPITIGTVNGNNTIGGLTGNLGNVSTWTSNPVISNVAPANKANIINNAATVGDVLNSGWNLQTESKPVDFVNPYDTVNFVGKDGTDISATSVNGTSTITIGAIKTIAGNTVTGGDNVDVDVTPNTDGSKNFEVNVKTGTLTPNVDGTVTNSGTGLATTSDVANAINNAGFKVAQNGNALSDLINPGDTVNYVNGTGTVANVTASTDGKGANVTYNVAVDNKTTQITYQTVGGKTAYAITDDKGNITGYNTQADGKGDVVNEGDIVSSQVSAKLPTVSNGTNIEVATSTNADGSLNYTVKTADDVTFNSTKIGGDPAKNIGPITIGTVNGNNTISGLSGNLNATTSDGTLYHPNGTMVSGQPITVSQAAPSNIGNIVNNAATVGDVLNSGWNLKANGNALDFVRPYDTVNFVGGQGITVKPDTDGKASNITVSADYSNLVLNFNGTNVTAKANGDGTYTYNLPNVTSGGSSFVLNTTNSSTGNVAGSTNHTVTPNSTITFDAGKNMNLTQTNGTVSIATNDNVTFNNVNASNVNVGPVVINNTTGIHAGDKKITGVADGEISPDSKDAVNGSQLYQVYTVIGGNQQTINTTPVTTNTTISAGGNATTGGNTTIAAGGDVKSYVEGDIATSGSNNNITRTMITYNVNAQNNYITNNVIDAISRMNEQGIQFFHTNDGTGRVRAVQGGNNNDSSASGAFATAIGRLAEAAGTNSIAMGFESRALGQDSISIGTKNYVTGKGSGAIGDPTTVTGNASYSVGNNNAVYTDDTFIMGNHVKQTQANSVFLGKETAYSYATGTNATLISNANQGIEDATNAQKVYENAKVALDNLNATIKGLEDSLTSTKADLANATTNNLTAKEIADLQTMESSLSKSITSEKAKVAGLEANVTTTQATYNAAVTKADDLMAAVKADEKTAASNSVKTNTGRTAGNTQALTQQTIEGKTYKYAGGNQTVGVVSVGSDTETRRIQNVAPGLISADSTDAINGSQLYALQSVATAGWTLSANGKNAPIPVSQTLNVVNGQGTTVAILGADTGKPSLQINTPFEYVDENGNTSTNATSTVSLVGDEPVKITNVKAGNTTYDAVNYGQLKDEVGKLNNRIDDVADEADAGTASAMATAGLPQAYLPGKSMVAVAGSTYRGKQGYAVGFSAITDGGNWIIKGSASGNSKGRFGATIGAGYQW